MTENNQKKRLRAVIFAGGVGTRLWPLSRRSSPKQFEKIIGNESTLQHAVKRLFPDFNLDDIFIATGNSYVALVAQQVPGLPKNHIIAEPQMRDIGPAVGLVATILANEHPGEPLAILWSDHLVRKEQLFRKILATACKIIEKNSDHMVFIGQKPRFASQNLGWIEYGKRLEQVDGIDIHAFKSFHYRPSLEKASEYFSQDHYAWNLGYFVTTPEFLLAQYRKFAPDMYDKLERIKKAWKTPAFNKTLAKIYPTLESIHFDNIILEKLDEGDASVITENIEWSDVGAWEALKEALQKTPEQNITNGRVLTMESRDSLIYNYRDQLVVTIDVDGFLVINTHDVLLICHKNSVPKIKKLVNSFIGTENEHLT